MRYSRWRDKYFEAARPRVSCRRAPVTSEPEQRGERRLLIERPGQNPLVQVAYHAIAANDPRQPALNLLQAILVGGDASRLHRSLVEERRVAVAVAAGWPEGFDPNIFSVHATLPAQGSVQAFESALDAELSKLVTHGVTKRELQRAQNIAAVDFWRGASTMDGKARLLGEYAVIHRDYRLLFDAPDAYQRVTCDDVNQIARYVFNPDRRTVGVLQAS
jgi:zinc protease